MRNNVIGQLAPVYVDFRRRHIPGLKIEMATHIAVFRGCRLTHPGKTHVNLWPGLFLAGVVDDVGDFEPVLSAGIVL